MRFEQIEKKNTRADAAATEAKEKTIIKKESVIGGPPKKLEDLFKIKIDSVDPKKIDMQ